MNEYVTKHMPDNCECRIADKNTLHVSKILQQIQQS